MSERVTKGDLEALVRVLNNRLGRPIVWGKPGNLHLQEAYGNGPRLYESLGLDKGEREVSPRLPRGQMAQYIRAVLEGIDLAEVNLRTAAPDLNGLPGWGERPRAEGVEAVCVACGHYAPPDQRVGTLHTTCWETA